MVLDFDWVLPSRRLRPDNSYQSLFGSCRVSTHFDHFFPGVIRIADSSTSTLTSNSSNSCTSLAFLFQHFFWTLMGQGEQTINPKLSIIGAVVGECAGFATSFLGISLENVSFSRTPFALSVPVLPFPSVNPSVAPILITILIVRRISRCPSGSWSWWCVSIADFKFSATSFQRISRTFSNSLIKIFFIGCHAVQQFRFLSANLCQNDRLVSNWNLANSRFHGPISD